VAALVATAAPTGRWRMSIVAWLQIGSAVCAFVVDAGSWAVDKHPFCEDFCEAASGHSITVGSPVW
jgi:hypothetical protein